MSQINHFLDKMDATQRIGYAALRVFVGAILLVRGWLLFTDPGTFVELVGEEKTFIWFAYISIAHMIGGLFITLGFYTRLGALIQIPILIGAALLMHNQDGLVMGGQSFELAVLVLALLVMYFICGAGLYSVRHYVRSKSLVQE